MATNISDQVQQSWDEIGAIKVSESHPQTLTVNHQTDRFEAELVAIDTMSCRVLTVRVVTQRFCNASSVELRQTADQLASQLIYLLEPIAPIEVDEDHSTVQMRSNPPHRDGKGTEYFELLVSRTGLSLCRYHQPADGLRSIIATGLTREIVGRLASDFLLE
tara:strand:- start:387 stop:872 length:486 start_codon:yes stop_codon:yes gene_type:complete